MENPPLPTNWEILPLQATHGTDMAIVQQGRTIAIIPHDPEIQTSLDPDYESVIWSPDDLKNAALIAAAPQLIDGIRIARKLAWDLAFDQARSEMDAENARASADNSPMVEHFTKILNQAEDVNLNPFVNR